MHIFFSGIGGTGIGPLALICKEAGFKVSGSDLQQSQYTDYLISKGVDLHIGQSYEQIKSINDTNPIDWIVFSSAVLINDTRHPEIVFSNTNGIKVSKRDECLNMLLKVKNLKLIAVSGTHGKTTTTSMLIWLFKQFKLPLSYSVGAKLSFGPMGKFEPSSQYFVYECDEFDRNFLHFNPHISIITSVDWDHHEIYPTRQSYQTAFRQFIDQSKTTMLYKKDSDYLKLQHHKSVLVLDDNNHLLNSIKLLGKHNRQNAFLCIKAFQQLRHDIPFKTIIDFINQFPGANRRFEHLTDNLYSDYAHTPEEIEAVIQQALELSDNIVVVYEPLTDRRQHYMKNHYQKVFNKVKKVYWLPSYLAREDPSKPILTPGELIKYLDPKVQAIPAEKNDELKQALKKAIDEGALVICIAGGGGGSLDEWTRKKLVS